MMDKKIKLTLYGGFHEVGPINIIVQHQDALSIMDHEVSLSEVLSESQKKRLEKHFCGIEGCCCGGVMRATIKYHNLINNHK